MFLVQEWIGGYELEMTDIYGMRRYEDGARLLTHVDRTSTHATSLIVNIAQGVMREPWMVRKEGRKDCYSIYFCHACLCMNDLLRRFTRLHDSIMLFSLFLIYFVLFILFLG